MAYAAGQKLRASQLSTYVCTSTTRPTGHSGQWIYETDTQMLAINDGSTWRYIAATGAVAQDVEYNMATAQSIPNITDTLVEFGLANVTSPMVTRTVSGSGHRFTVGRAGRWVVVTTLRYGSSAAAGERYGAIRKNANPVSSQGTVKAAVGAPVTFNLTATLRLVVGDIIDVITFQGSGGAASLETNNNSAWGRLNISWIGP